MASILSRGLKVLALFDLGQPTGLEQDFSEELETEAWKTEAHVLSALRKLGCDVEYLAIHDNTDLLRQKLETFPADVIFNLVEEFRNKRALDQAVVSFLELAGVPYTGCGSTGLTLCRHKGISKKILGYHRIRVPQFAVLARGRRIARPRWLPFPILVKPLKEEASTGIAQASFVENDDEFRDRVGFVHDKLGHDVIAEEYIAGRELYVSVVGNQRLEVFPIREMLFKEVPPDEPRFATYKAKWDDAYRKRWGIENQFAGALAPEVKRSIERTCRRIYHLLAMDGYGRIDLRLTPENEIVFIEANPNPFLAEDEDFALSAAAAGVDYATLIGRIVQLGMRAVRH
ncbi:MAG TPA: hypothetical protein VGA56_01675 [Opitutaceae bacterium]